MEEREQAQGGHETQVRGRVSPQQQGAKGTQKSPPSAPAPPTELPSQLRLREGRAVGGSSAGQRLPSGSPRQGTPWRGPPSVAPSC